MNNERTAVRQRHWNGCPCCGHQSRDCGGFMCACRIRRIEAATLVLSEETNTDFFGVAKRTAKDYLAS